MGVFIRAPQVCICVGGGEECAFKIKFAIQHEWQLFSWKKTNRHEPLSRNVGAPSPVQLSKPLCRFFLSFQLKNKTGFVIGRSRDGKVADIDLSSLVSYICFEDVLKGRRASGFFSQSGSDSAVCSVPLTQAHCKRQPGRLPGCHRAQSLPPNTRSVVLPISSFTYQKKNPFNKNIDFLPP